MAPLIQGKEIVIISAFVLIGLIVVVYALLMANYDHVETLQKERDDARKALLEKSEKGPKA